MTPNWSPSINLLQCLWHWVELTRSVNDCSHLSLLAKDVQTVSALMTFFLAMLMFPEVQKRAQDEIDNVIGGGRLPTSADRDALPYIEAIMKETHRWHQVLPMCIPHTSTEEDVCRGYRIPKGSILLPNNW